MAESLIELSDEYGKMLHPIHDFEIKHGQKILLYSAYGDNFENSSTYQGRLACFYAANQVRLGLL